MLGDMTLHDIVVAIDFAPASVDALRFAAHHLAPEARLTLVHCIDLPPASSIVWQTLPAREEMVASLRRAAESRFATLLAELPRERVCTQVRVGSAAETLAAVAQQEGCDLTVVGEHSHPAGAHWRPLGSTAERLVVHSRRPVLLVRKPPAGPPRTVLAAIDESELATKALGWACAVGARHQARVIAFHAITDWYVRQVARQGNAEQAQALGEAMQARGRAWLNGVVAEHPCDGAEIEPHLALGRASEASLRAIEDLQVDLAVIGSHGLASFTDPHQPRLSRFLLLGAPCSLLMVP